MNAHEDLKTASSIADLVSKKTILLKDFSGITVTWIEFFNQLQLFLLLTDMALPTASEQTASRCVLSDLHPLPHTQTHLNPQTSLACSNVSQPSHEFGGAVWYESWGDDRVNQGVLRCRHQHDLSTLLAKTKHLQY